LADVRDLKNGMTLIEDRARLELGMIKPNEIFVQYAK
jgi:cell division protein FtsB